MKIESNPPVQKYKPTASDLRMLVGNQMLALARKEVPAADVLAAAKSLNAVSKALNAEVKKAKIVIREAT